MIEHISIEFWKTETKTCGQSHVRKIILKWANENRGKGKQTGQTCVTKSGLVLALNVFVWEDGASFMD